MVPALAGVVAVVLASGGATAQVGYPPSKSPFLDVEQRHEITPFFGYFSAKVDPAKVAPQGGPMGGLMYQWRASGPVHIGLSFMTVSSKRLELDPSKPEASRTVGTETRPLYAADGFISVSLTGGRSWHHLMPMVGGGLGLITNAKGADVGGFRFGTRFAFPWGAGVRWIPGGGPLQLRADIKDWMYTIKYPQAYYQATAGSGTAILAAGTQASRWTNNFAMTFGGSYTFKR
jgi:hypothetical protein